jgi:hypothetical protein
LVAASGVVHKYRYIKTICYAAGYGTKPFVS